MAPWVHAWAGCMKFLFPNTWSPFLAWANTPCKEHPTYSVLQHIWFFKKKLPDFSNVSDPENCPFWINQNLKRTPRFHSKKNAWLFD
jgi:hypothetical protein